MKKLLIALIAILTMIATMTTASYAAEVKNLRSSQVGNHVLFEYDLAGEDKEADIGVTLTINGKQYKTEDLHIEGDYEKVKTGNGRKIYWNVLQDFPRGYSGEFDYQIVAGGTNYTDPVTGMEFVYVKGGCYEMGCGGWTSNCDDDEKPVHEVCVDDFYIGKYEVTQGQWREIMEKDFSYFENCGDDCPVERVSWNDIQKFTSKLNHRTNKNYRLPTEAEWEYAGRSGGKKEKWAGTDNKSRLRQYAWFYNNSGNKTHPVGQKRPNGLGLYDMSGNVWEWVNDWYGERYYSESAKNNPKGPGKDWTGLGYRVLRGGSCSYDSEFVRTTYRLKNYHLSRVFYYGGFRLSRTP